MKDLELYKLLDEVKPFRITKPKLQELGFIDLGDNIGIKAFEYRFSKQYPLTREWLSDKDNAISDFPDFVGGILKPSYLKSVVRLYCQYKRDMMIKSGFGGYIANNFIAVLSNTVIDKYSHLFTGVSDFHDISALSVCQFLFDSYLNDKLWEYIVFKSFELREPIGRKLLAKILPKGNRKFFYKLTGLGYDKKDGFDSSTLFEGLSDVELSKIIWDNAGRLLTVDSIIEKGLIRCRFKLKMSTIYKRFAKCYPLSHSALMSDELLKQKVIKIIGMGYHTDYLLPVMHYFYDLILKEPNDYDFKNYTRTTFIRYKKNTFLDLFSDNGRDFDIKLILPYYSYFNKNIINTVFSRYISEQDDLFLDCLVNLWGVRAKGGLYVLDLFRDKLINDSSYNMHYNKFLNSLFGIKYTKEDFIEKIRGKGISKFSDLIKEFNLDISIPRFKLYLSLIGLNIKVELFNYVKGLLLSGIPYSDLPTYYLNTGCVTEGVQETVLKSLLKGIFDVQELAMINGYNSSYMMWILNSMGIINNYQLSNVIQSPCYFRFIECLVTGGTFSLNSLSEWFKEVGFKLSRQELSNLYILNLQSYLGIKENYDKVELFKQVVDNYYYKILCNDASFGNMTIDFDEYGFVRLIKE